MAPATRTSRRKPASKPAAKPAAKRTTAKPRAASKATTAKLDAGRRKAEAAAKVSSRKVPERRSHAEKIKLGKTIMDRMRKGEKMGDIATSLKLYPFQAHQLVALVHVDKGDVPAITGKSEDVLVKRLAAARAKGDEYASWDWLQARSGMNKVKIQKLLVEAGVKITDVRNDRKGTPTKRAAPRAASKPAAKPASVKAKASKRMSKPAAVKPRTRTVTLSKSVKPPIKGKLPVKTRKEKIADKSRESAAVARAARARNVAAKKAAAPKRKPTGAAKASVDRKAGVGKRTRTPVNVPRGARPTGTPDPS